MLHGIPVVAFSYYSAMYQGTWKKTSDTEGYGTVDANPKPAPSSSSNSWHHRVTWTGLAPTQNSDGDISVDPAAEPEDSDSDTLGMKVNAAFLRLTRVDEKDPAQVLTYGGNEEESVAPE